MEQNHHSFKSGVNDSAHLKNVTMSMIDLVDEINIEENSFKPITKGLGFHNEPKAKHFQKSLKKVVERSSMPPLPNVRGGVNHSARNSILNHQENSVDAPVSPMSPVSPLSQFYQQASHQSPNGLSVPSHNISSLSSGNAVSENIFPRNSEEKIYVQADYKVASLSKQFLAFIIDLGMVLSFVLATVALLVFVSRIELNILNQLISHQDKMIFGSAIFTIYFMLYFTILELNTTPGKALLGLRLVHGKNQNVRVSHTFFRSLFTLLSVPALMLPTVLDFQGKLSGTLVVQDKE